MNDYVRAAPPELTDPDRLAVPGAVSIASPGVRAPQQDTRLGDLAQSLSSFSTGVGAFESGLASVANSANRETTDQKRLDRLKALNTPEEFDAKVRSGEIPRDFHPNVQVKADMISGQYAAANLSKEYAEAIGTGALRPEDGPQWLQQRREQITQDNGWQGDSGQAWGFGAGYNSLLATAQQKVLGARVQAQEDHTNQSAAQLVQIDMDSVFGKVPPQDAWDVINKTKSQLVTGLKRTPKEADAIIWADLGRRVADDPNWAVEFASAKRQGVNGEEGVVPALAEHPQRADTFASWQKVQQTTNVKAAKAATEQAVAADDLNHLLAGDGSFQAIADTQYTNPVDNSTETLTREKRQSTAVAAFNAQSTAAAKAHGETPTQTFNREAQVFIDNGVVNSAWKGEIESAVKLANNTDLTDPAKGQQLGVAFNRFKAIEDRSPAYAKDLLNDKSRSFFTTARVLQDYAQNPDGSRFTDAQALNGAANAIRIETPETADFMRPQLDAIKNKIDSLANPHSAAARALWGTLGYDYANARNRSEIIREMHSLSTALAKSGGLGGDEAVDAAAQYMAKTGQVVGGMWMRKSSNNDFDYGQVSSRILSDYAKSPAGQAEGYHPGDLTLKDTGQGYFMVLDGNGIPVHGGARLSHGDLVGVQQTLNAEREAGNLRLQHATAMRASAAAAAKAADPDQQFTTDGRHLPFSTAIVKGYHLIADPANDSAYEQVMSGRGLVGRDSAVGKAIIQRYNERHGIKNE